MSTPTLTVYSKPACMQCTMTVKELEKLGIPYQVKSLQDDPEKVEQFKAAGLLSAPVVVPADGSAPWAGFVPEKIHAYAPVAA